MVRDQYAGGFDVERDRELTGLVVTIEARAVDAEARAVDAEARAVDAEARAVDAEARAHAMELSWSWRVTAPLRVATRPFRR